MKIRPVSVFLAALILFFCFVPQSLAAEENYIVAAEDGAWLYYLASDASAKLTLARRGTVLAAYEQSAGFIKTSFDGYVGWVSLADLSPAEGNGLWGLLIESLPEKTVYYEDEAFLSDGLTVTAVYNDGTRVPPRASPFPRRICIPSGKNRCIFPGAARPRIFRSRFSACRSIISKSLLSPPSSR